MEGITSELVARCKRMASLNLDLSISAWDCNANGLESWLYSLGIAAKSCYGRTPLIPAPGFGVVGKVAMNLGAWVALLLVSVLLHVCE